MTLELPRELVEADSRDPIPGRRAWIGRLPGIVSTVAEHWELRLGSPYQPGGQCSWVAPVVAADGRGYVLKIGWSHPESLHEADALQLWAGAGAVLLHRRWEYDDTSALLLERCVPGTTLGDSLPGLDQDEILARLLRRLWVAPGEGHRFRPLTQMCDWWADEFEAELAAQPHAVDAGIARAGIALYRELPRTADRSVLLPTDLHGGNVLAAEREPWLVVDPKPYLGDPAYDLTQHMLNDPERLQADPTGWADRMADLAGLDRERVRRWQFARAVQESFAWPYLRKVARRVAP